jgi:hypothetical protein
MGIERVKMPKRVIEKLELLERVENGMDMDIMLESNFEGGNLGSY